MPMNPIADKSLLNFDVLTPARLLNATLTKEASMRVTKNKKEDDYCIDLGFDPADPTYGALKARLVQLAKEAWGQPIKTWDEDEPVETAIRFCLGGGERFADRAEKANKEFYRGLGVVRAKSNNSKTTGAPAFSTHIKIGGEILPHEATKFYSGAYICAQLNLYVYDSKGLFKLANGKLNKDFVPRGISAYFQKLLFVRDGEKLFKGGRDAAEVFRNVEGQEISEDPRLAVDDDIA